MDQYDHDKHEPKRRHLDYLRVLLSVVVTITRCRTARQDTIDTREEISEVAGQ